jgi:NAD+ kinase
MNEITVSRKDTTSMITIDTYLNEEYLNSYWADGQLFQPQQDLQDTLKLRRSYFDPRCKSLVITPIAPHNLTARPLVVPDETEIRLKVSGRDEYYLVSLDSRVTSVRNESVLTLKKTPFQINMVEIRGNLLKKHCSKLLWEKTRGIKSF